MTERQGTQDIFKYVMAAPPAEPLTLSAVDLMLLREWLRLDALEIDSLNAELAALHDKIVAEELYSRSLEKSANRQAGTISKLRAWRFPMKTDISKPIPVETPAKITTLESALIALRYDGSKSIHLSIRQAETVLIRIDWLERQLKRRDDTISDLADRLAAYEVGAFEEGLDE